MRQIPCLLASILKSIKLYDYFWEQIVFIAEYSCFLDLIKVLGRRLPNPNSNHPPDKGGGEGKSKVHPKMPADTQGDIISNNSIVKEFLWVDNKSESVESSEFGATLLDVTSHMSQERGDALVDMLKPFDGTAEILSEDGAANLPQMIALDHYQYMHFRRIFEAYANFYWIVMRPTPPAPVGFLLSGPGSEVNSLRSTVRYNYYNLFYTYEYCTWYIGVLVCTRTM